MKATEVTEPGYYWVRDDSATPVRWYIVEMDGGMFFAIGMDGQVPCDDAIGDLYGPILPPRGHAFRERRGDR